MISPKIEHFVPPLLVSTCDETGDKPGGRLSGYLIASVGVQLAVVIDTCLNDDGRASDYAALGMSDRLDVRTVGICLGKQRLEVLEQLVEDPFAMLRGNG